MTQLNEEKTQQNNRQEKDKLHSSKNTLYSLLPYIYSLWQTWGHAERSVSEAVQLYIGSITKPSKTLAAS